jgi:hypothetical protein
VAVTSDKTDLTDIDQLARAVQEALSRVRRAMKNPPPDLLRIEESISGT